MMAALLSLAAAGICFGLCYALIQVKIKPQQELSQRLWSIDSHEEDGKTRTPSPRATQRGKDGRKTPNFHQRVIIPFQENLGRWITNLAPATWSKELEHKLVLAGKSKVWSVQAYAVFWTVMVGLGILVGFKYIADKGDMAFIQSLMVLVVFAGIFGMLPLVILRILIQKRQDMILHQLPEVLDLLCVSVQAGLSFDAALRRIVDKMQGVLIDELKRMLEDIRMGLQRRQAMRMLADRCEVQELTLFCTSLIQAERLGTSIGKTLTNQAANMRERHRMRIKAQAMKAPVKMMFPLVLFIFPALFVIVLLPSLISLMHNFIK